MASLEEIRSSRIEKLKVLRNKKIDPYPITSDVSFSLSQARDKFSSLVEEKTEVTLTGRIMAVREHGGVIFFDLDDGTAKFQSCIKKDDLGEESFNIFKELVDIGDFLQVCGALFLTKKQEETISVTSWRILSKSLRPLPDKWHGLRDVDERFRKRYLDLLMSPEVKSRIVMRSKILSGVRKILEEAGYIEVETPVLQPLAGGATAEPFKTHHNALDLGLYLRIAPELYLKQLLIGGLPKVFEFTRNFRNEGIDLTHNPEFTAVEFYESYSDATKQRHFVEFLIRSLVENIFGRSNFYYDGKNIDVSKEFSVRSYFDLLKEYSGINSPGAIPVSELKEIAKRVGLDVSVEDSREKILDAIYKKTCRSNLIQPTFIVDYPVDYLPLAKKKPSDPKFVDAFQLVIGGVELVKAFSELNDPIDQAERFSKQESLRASGDKEAQLMDKDFVEALEYGMPPAGGVGIGLDRLVMVLTDTKNIKEIILFPVMRPKE